MVIITIIIIIIIYHILQIFPRVSHISGLST